MVRAGRNHSVPFCRFFPTTSQINLLIRGFSASVEMWISYQLTINIICCKTFQSKIHSTWPPNLSTVFRALQRCFGFRERKLLVCCCFLYNLITSWLSVGIRFHHVFVHNITTLYSEKKVLETKLKFFCFEFPLEFNASPSAEQPRIVLPFYWTLEPKTGISCFFLALGQIRRIVHLKEKILT